MFNKSFLNDVRKSLTAYRKSSIPLCLKRVKLNRMILMIYEIPLKKKCRIGLQL